MCADNNRIPDEVKKIHLIAVCGTAMGALACMLKDLGYDVSGTDNNVYPPMSTFLAQKGIQVNNGYNGRHLGYRPDLVVVGNAVSRDNSEVVAMRELGLSFCSMPQALNHFVVGEKQSILVTGTHGKTTTSALMAWILQTAGYDPSFMVGGILRNFDSNYRLGQGPYVVIEGDEYDTAYFDKGPKFLHFSPHSTVLTGIEFDHADIFRDLAHVISAFEAFMSRLAPASLLVAYHEDANVQALLSGTDCRIQTYGRDGDADWYFTGHSIQPPYTRFDVVHSDRSLGRFRTELMGSHNLLNALSVIAVARNLGISIQTIDRALQSFKNVRRRQEIRGVRNQITVMDDFAHHPTAVRETVKAVKPYYPDGRLIAVFEPRTNSSMRSVFQDVYPQSFEGADMVCIRKPALLEKIPPGQRFSSAKLVQDLNAKGLAAHYFEDTDAIIDFLAGTARAGDLILIMSNGGFDNIHQRLLDRL